MPNVATLPFERVCDAPNDGVKTMVRDCPFQPLYISAHCPLHVRVCACFYFFLFSRDGASGGGVRETIRQRLDVGKRGETKVRPGAFASILSTEEPQRKGLSFSEAFFCPQQSEAHRLVRYAIVDHATRDTNGTRLLPERQPSRNESSLVFIQVDFLRPKGFRRLTRGTGSVSTFDFSCKEIS